MRRIFACVVALLLCVFVLQAETNETYVRCIAFYNLENLFDTIHDEGKND